MLLLDDFLSLFLQQTNVSYQKNIHNSAQNWHFTGKWKNKNMTSPKRIDSESFESKHRFLQDRKIKSRMQVMKQKVKAANNATVWSLHKPMEDRNKLHKNPGWKICILLRICLKLILQKRVPQQMHEEILTVQITILLFVPSFLLLHTLTMRSPSWELTEKCWSMKS